MLTCPYCGKQASNESGCIEIGGRRRRSCLQREVYRLRKAVTEHHAQKADDRCIEDDDKLYAAFGLPPCDRRVGSKEEMLQNCKRYIENRCEAGGWKSYAELEAENAEFREILESQKTSKREQE